MSIVKEFKEFISRGNVIDLAVGIIIGGAFGQITLSLVNDILMPPLGLLIAGVDFGKLAYQIKPAVEEGGKIVTEDVVIRYGMFIQTVINFLIIAFSVFLIVKIVNSLRKSRAGETESEIPAAPTLEESLLTEIRDILRSNGSSNVPRGNPLPPNKGITES